MHIRKAARATLAPFALVAIVGLVAACAATGGSPSTTTGPSAAASTRPTPAPTPTAVATVATPEPSPSQEVATMPFTLTSADFVDGAPIPTRHSCDGGDVSPALDWTGAPDGTASFVLIVDDPDARGFVHWVLFDLTGSATGGLPAGFADSPDAPRQGTNDFGRLGYGGPCPPSGTHRYVFTLAALDVQSLGLTGAPKAAEVRDAMAGHVLGTATLTGTYAR